MLWQEEQAGFLRCSSILSRTERGVMPVWFSSSAGMLGGGGGTGVPRTLSSSHLPRRTGEVRVAFEVVDSHVRKLSLEGVVREGESGVVEI